MVSYSPCALLLQAIACGRALDTPVSHVSHAYCGPHASTHFQPDYSCHRVTSSVASLFLACDHTCGSDWPHECTKQQLPLLAGAGWPCAWCFRRRLKQCTAMPTTLLRACGDLVTTLLQQDNDLQTPQSRTKPRRRCPLPPPPLV